jgi:hypothetical protein
MSAEDYHEIPSRQPQPPPLVRGLVATALAELAA